MTKAILPALAVLAPAALAFTTTPALADEHMDDGDRAGLTEGEQKLAKLLEGRVAGEPESCIRDRPVRNFQVIDNTAIVYRIGSTIWVNRTKNPRTLDDNETLVFRRYGSQICSTDIVSTIDRFGGFYTGNIFLDHFVPYRKADQDG
ncbi:hypothetical protein [Erythrobacter litoralis]|uniref:Uncharacterized protein n=1 Tax=Erythrobacter litoralis (strain HTCC2594) TaxID=314225 RepID=Q2N7B2_ERYLH|nr:hypothetical protein [Erythrobacter litoralis]ABC64429.1 hypothetical protein ELI_11685 [Erythrobacter litoralis HTCC2594]